MKNASLQQTKHSSRCFCFETEMFWVKLCFVLELVSFKISNAAALRLTIEMLDCSGILSKMVIVKEFKFYELLVA